MTGHTGELRHCDTPARRLAAAPASSRNYFLRQVNWNEIPTKVNFGDRIEPRWRRPPILEGQLSVRARRKDRGE